MDPFAFYALVVDNNPLFRMNAQAILAKAGFRVFAAAKCEDALEILSKRGHGITLLFTDVEMPSGTMTGFSLARYCASGWPHIGILVAAGANLPKQGDLPAHVRFIQKPFNEAVVKHHLKQVLPEQQQPCRLRMALVQDQGVPDFGEPWRSPSDLRNEG
ncbi:response regulator [Paracoccus benzoatiresistens]|uniref:Response regulator n=1 Tax=Paracoccus benzoatiresistens TaxID=2997341 RepID=A0ABT4JCM5_9RHOB|nr:response regulator [Paracoccus sp. EF6]MCZ0964256.1 response regulator [Paracoccus sp. EF6]